MADSDHQLQLAKLSTTKMTQSKIQCQFLFVSFPKNDTASFYLLPFLSSLGVLFSRFSLWFAGPGVGEVWGSRTISQLPELGWVESPFASWLSVMKVPRLVHATYSSVESQWNRCCFSQRIIVWPGSSCRTEVSSGRKKSERRRYLFY